MSCGILVLNNSEGMLRKESVFSVEMSTARVLFFSVEALCDVTYFYFG